MAITESTLIDAGVGTGLLSAHELSGLRLQAKRERLSLIEVLCRTKRVPEAALYRSLASLHGLDYLDFDELEIDQQAFMLFPRQLRQRLVLPVMGDDNERFLVLADPEDHISVERAERATEQSYKLALSEPIALKNAMNKVSNSTAESALTVNENTSSDPVQILDEIMKQAYYYRASDIHFEPQEEGMRVRIRVDGSLREMPCDLARTDEEPLINRLKVLADLDIGEQHMTQDGAMKYAFQDWVMDAIDIRMAIIPSYWGERATLRILNKGAGQLTLSTIGMSDKILADFRKNVNQPHGMILVTGPTGSGKSTTLYSTIRELDTDRVNVLAVEDPVEQTVEGITQVQVSTKVNFAQALRSFLRHDPDVVLVGEMRDQETADIGLRAAMTGHLVLSTLHTNDSVAAVSRLVDMGVERFLVSSTLLGVLAQRLTRRLCPHCRQVKLASEEELKALDLEPNSEVEIYEPGACSICLGLGFAGRIGFFEALWVDDDLRQKIASGVPESELRQSARYLTTLWQDARDKVLAGEIALSEVLHYKKEF